MHSSLPEKYSVQSSGGSAVLTTWPLSGNGQPIARSHSKFSTEVSQKARSTASLTTPSVSSCRYANMFSGESG